MAEHILKTLAPYWDAISAGDKNFEVRRDDRGFQRGDVLVLRRIEKPGAAVSIQRLGGPDGIDVADSLTGLGQRIKWRDTEYYDLRKRITYVLTGGQLGIEPGYVVLGLADEAEKCG